MPITPVRTGKTGADGWSRAIKRQAIIWAHYGPKLAAVAAAAHAAGVLDDIDYAALQSAFNALPALLTAISKLAEYAGF